MPRHTYFFRVNEDDESWHRCVANINIEWGYWLPYAEVVELMPDGTGLYRRCKNLPMKEECFRKLPETMAMIALQAHTI